MLSILKEWGKECLLLVVASAIWYLISGLFFPQVVYGMMLGYLLRVIAEREGRN